MKKLILLILGFVLLPGLFNEVLSQCEVVSNASGIQGIGSNSTAQSFTPGCNVRLNSLQLFDPGNLTIFDSLEIRTGEGLSGEVIHTEYFTSKSGNPVIELKGGVDIKENQVYSYTFYRAQGQITGSGNYAAYSGGSLFRDGAQVAGDLKFDFDVTPATEFNAFTFSVDEKLPVGTVVDTLKVFNPDNEVISFEILSGNINNTFAVDNDGVITISNNEQLDDEINPGFDLVIRTITGSVQANVSVTVILKNTDPLAELEQNFDDIINGEIPQGWSDYNIDPSNIGVVENEGVQGTKALQLAGTGNSEFGFITPLLSNELPVTVSFRMRQDGGASLLAVNLFAMDSINDPNPQITSSEEDYIATHASYPENPSIYDGSLYEMNLDSLENQYLLVKVSPNTNTTDNYTIWIDDFTFTETNFPPVAQISIDNQLVKPGYDSLVFELENAFTDENNDDLILTAVSSHPSRASVEINEQLQLIVKEAGQTQSANITVTASDEKGLTASISFTVLNQELTDPTIYASVLNGSNGIQLNGGATPNQPGIDVGGIGDFNGDGFDDYAVSAPDVTANSQLFAGQVYVIYGNDDQISGFNFSSLDGTNGFKISGSSQNERMGNSVSGGLDVNNDGLDDFVISSASATYVIYGGTDISGDSFNPTSLTGVNGFKVNSTGDVSLLEDINADGINDIVVGTNIIFGSETQTATIDVANLGTKGFKVNKNGVVGSAGDINGDGFGDLLIGMKDDSPDSDRTSDGIVYVLFGNTSLSGTIDLTALSGNTGFKVLAKATTGNLTSDLGQSISGTGDFNDDGIDDIVLGSPKVNGRLGEAYVIFGSTSRNTNIDLVSLSEADGLTIQGYSAGTIGGTPDVGETGTSVSGNFDFNGDGLMDVVLGSPFQNQTRGDAAIIYGSSMLSGTIAIDQLDYQEYALIRGYDSGFGKLGIKVSEAGDVNNDGYDDVVIGSQNGKSFIFYGKPLPNLPPEVEETIPDQSLTIGQSLELDFSGRFSDPEGTDISISATSENESIATVSILDKTITLTGIAIGEVNIKVTGTDEGGASSDIVFALLVIDNNPPTVANPLADVNGTEDEILEDINLANTFTDSDGSITTISAASTSTEVTTDIIDEVLSISVAENYFGEVTITVTAFDDDGASVTDDFLLSITGVNDEPVLSGSLNDQSTLEDELYSFDLSTAPFSDVEDASLSYSISGAGWLNIDESIISGTPSNDDVGVHTVTVVATDSEGASVSGDYDVIVENVNDAPTGIFLSNQKVEEEQEPGVIVGDLSTEDVDLQDTHTYTISGTDAEAFSIDGNQLKTASVLNLDDQTSFNIDITTTDSGGETHTESFVITLIEVVLSINNQEFINVYPNPVQKNMFINSDQYESVQIINMEGKVLLKTNLKNQENVIEMTDFKQGIYILRLTNRNGDTVSQRVIKH